MYSQEARHQFLEQLSRQAEINKMVCYRWEFWRQSLVNAKENNTMDPLTKLFNDNVKDDMTPMQIFQTAFTLSAVSMRQRAMEACNRKTTDQNTVNAIKNEIGRLPDIPAK